MFKNAIIALLATGLLFSNTILSEYGLMVYIAFSMVSFAIVCWIEMKIEKHMAIIRRWKKFQRTVNRKIALNQPSKVS